MIFAWSWLVLSAKPRTRQGGPMWESLAPWERAAAWEKQAPDTAKAIIQLIGKEQRHRHRLAWVRIVVGFGCVLVMAPVAWHYADVGLAVAGVSYGAGTVAIVGIFVTGQRIRRRL